MHLLPTHRMALSRVTGASTTPTHFPRVMPRGLAFPLPWQVQPQEGKKRTHYNTIFTPTKDCFQLEVLQVTWHSQPELGAKMARIWYNVQLRVATGWVISQEIMLHTEGKWISLKSSFPFQSKSWLKISLAYTFVCRKTSPYLLEKKFFRNERERETFNVIYIAGLNGKKVFHSLAVGLSWLKYLQKLFFSCLRSSLNRCVQCSLLFFLFWLLLSFFLYPRFKKTWNHIFVSFTVFPAVQEPTSPNLGQKMDLKLNLWGRLLDLSIE